MILWTIMPTEQVLEGLENSNVEKPSTSSVEIEHKGRRMIVEPLGLNSAKVVQLISTDPADYLIEEFTPGNIIVLNA